MFLVKCLGYHFASHVRFVDPLPGTMSFNCGVWKQNCMANQKTDKFGGAVKVNIEMYLCLGSNLLTDVWIILLPYFPKKLSSW